MRDIYLIGIGVSLVASAVSCFVAISLSRRLTRVEREIMLRGITVLHIGAARKSWLGRRREPAPLSHQ